MSKPNSSGFNPEKILVAVDGSENSRRAAKFATHLAKNYGASLIVFMAPTIPLYPAEAGIQEYIQFEEDEAKNVTNEIAELARKEGVEAKATVSELSSSAVSAITKAALDSNASLIVIGTRGLGGFRRLLLGSVSSGVVAHAGCDVLVVR